MSLPGPSRTIEVEPVTIPKPAEQPAPEPEREPAPEPEREPEKEPAHA